MPYNLHLSRNEQLNSDVAQLCSRRWKWIPPFDPFLGSAVLSGCYAWLWRWGFVGWLDPPRATMRMMMMMLMMVLFQIGLVQTSKKVSWLVGIVVAIDHPVPADDQWCCSCWQHSLVSSRRRDPPWHRGWSTQAHQDCQSMPPSERQQQRQRSSPFVVLTFASVPYSGSSWLGMSRWMNERGREEEERCDGSSTDKKTRPMPESDHTENEPMVYCRDFCFVGGVNRLIRVTFEIFKEFETLVPITQYFSAVWYTNFRIARLLHMVHSTHPRYGWQIQHPHTNLSIDTKWHERSSYLSFSSPTEEEQTISIQI